MLKILIVSIMCVFSSISIAEQASEGVYGQTSASPHVGDCSTCEIKISKLTPHVVQIDANNGWVGFAYYSQQDEKYRGAFEWKSGKGGAYDKVLFLIDLIYEGQTLTMNARSNSLNFSTTYRKK